MSVPLRAACFDASALVKRYVVEDGSDKLRLYWTMQRTQYTTTFCLYETLSALKGKWRGKVLSRDEYLRAARDLVVWFRCSKSAKRDLAFTEDHDVFKDAAELVERFAALDLSDALQLVTLQAGYFAGLMGQSASVLVTADAALANAARTMKLPVWDCMRDPLPPY